VASFDKTKVEISQTIFEHVPKEAEITRIEFEGPALAVYTKKPEILIEPNDPFYYIPISNFNLGS